jgi:PST family polysaccharide transporter
VQFDSLDDDDLHTVFWANIGFALLLTVLTVAFADRVSALFRANELTPILRALSVQLIITGLISLQVAILRRRMNFKALSIRSLLSVLTGGTVGVVLALMGFGVWALVFRAIVGSISDVLFLWTASEWRPQFRFSLSRFKTLVNFGVKVMGINFFDDIRENVDYFLIGLFLNTELLGYYSIGYRLVATMNKVVFGLIDSVFLPIFSRIQNDINRYSRSYLQITELSSYVLLPFFMALFVLARPITLTAFGPEWESSIPVTRWLSLLGISGTFFMFSKTGLLSIGKPERTLVASLLDTGLSVIGMLAGLPFGISGVAIGRSTSSTLAMPFPQLMFLKSLGISIREFFNAIRSSLLSGFITMAGTFPGLYFIDPQQYYTQFSVCFLGGSLAWLVYTFFFKRPYIILIKEEILKG